MWKRFTDDPNHKENRAGPGRTGFCMWKRLTDDPNHMETRAGPATRGCALGRGPGGGPGLG